MGVVEWITDVSCIVDPLGQTMVMTGSDLCFHAHINVFYKTIIAGRVEGLSKWIINNSRIVLTHQATAE